MSTEATSNRIHSHMLTRSLALRPQSWNRLLIWLVLVVVIFVASITRLYFLFYRGGFSLDQLDWAANNYYGGITYGYLQMKATLLSGGFEQRPWAYLPGYPAFLALLQGAGIDDLAFVRFAQAIIDSLAVLPLYYVLSHLGRSTYLAILGCLVYAAAPWWAAGSTYLLAESLLPALVILLLAAMVLARDHPERSTSWFLLGLFAAILPFFRSEMVLLFGPLAIWALLVASKRKRLSSAACVVAGFVFPLLLWALRNYYVHGQFMLTPPAKWYAAWSGLGQLPNNFGYFVSDANASELLRENGIKYHSAEAEAFWFREYVAAWINHPFHVVATIMHRIKLISSTPDVQSLKTPLSSVLRLYSVAPLVAAIAIGLLLQKRRWADAFLIALPLGYAIASLGLIYVELRYVRYASLSYILAITTLLAIVANAIAPRWPLRLPSWRQISTCGFALAFSATLFFAMIQVTAIDVVVQSHALAQRLDVENTSQPALGLDALAITPIKGVKVSKHDSGTSIYATVPANYYLLTAPTGAAKNGAAIIHYTATLHRGAIGIGTLPSDGSRWLGRELISGLFDLPIKGEFILPVEAGSFLVIDAQHSGSTVDATLNKFTITITCSDEVSLMRLFFNKAKVNGGSCRSP